MIDYKIAVPVLLLTFIGLITLNGVLKAGYGYGTYPANMLKQVVAVIIGLMFAIIIVNIQTPTLNLMSAAVYVVSLLLLIWVHIDGYSLANETGQDSWIRLPVFGSFQPSELAKIGIAMVAANILEEMKLKRCTVIQGVLKLGACYGVPLFLILREPDFGTAAVIIGMLAVSLFVWGIKWGYIIAAIVGVSVSLPAVWFFYFDDYQKNRILTVLFPGHDARASYHIDRALKAIASGGLIGHRGRSDWPVPVKESDFIFTAIAEYYGFIAGGTVIVLSAIFIIRVLYVALKIEKYSPSSSYLLTALAAMLAFHMIENMGMNVGLLPITGIPLPFVSNGGTSMVVNFMAFGLILNIAGDLKERREIYEGL